MLPKIEITLTYKNTNYQIITKILYTSVDPHIQYAVIVSFNQLWYRINNLLLQYVISYDYICSIMITYGQL